VQRKSQPIKAARFLLLPVLIFVVLQPTLFSNAENMRREKMSIKPNPVLSSAANNALDTVQNAHFQFFKDMTNDKTGLVKDRSRDDSAASIAAVGFALSVYPIAAERGFISRKEASDWALKVLRTLWRAPQGPEPEGNSGYHGYFYHFLDPATGLRAAPPVYWHSELSSIDTALLMAGVRFARNYFDGNGADETEIRDLSDKLFNRVEWDWLLVRTIDQNPNIGCLLHGWIPETGLIKNVYKGYSEAPLLYLLAMGSPTHAIPQTSWATFIGGAKTETFYRQRIIRCPGSPLFVYQYPHCFIDFRGIFDDNNRRVGFDYFENSRRATIAQHLYAKKNPKGFRGYDSLNWGLTACDGPGNGSNPKFLGYSERGCPDGTDDGTIAPTAALSSLPFTPSIVWPTLRYWLKYRPELFGKHGFVDAFNPTFDSTSESGWIDPETISIDQGPVLIMIENYRSQFAWKVMHKDEVLRKGLEQAGFVGGWLTQSK